MLYELPKKKLNWTLKNIGVSPVNIHGVSPVNIHGVAQHSHASNAEGKLEKVLNVYKENISTAYVSDIEIEERDTKNMTEELDRLHATMKKTFATASNTEKLQILTLFPDSWSQKYCSE